MAKIKRTTFEVTGFGEFPFDMLRYDSCWPARGEDAALVACYPDEDRWTKRRTVRLQSDSPSLTPRRWFSFGWTFRVLEVW